MVIIHETTGEIKFSPRAALMMHFIKQDYAKKVSVPVSMTHDMIAFDIHQVLERASIVSQVSDDEIKKLLEMLGKTLAHVDAVEVRQILAAYSLSEQQLDNVVSGMQNSIVKNMTNGSLQTVFLQLDYEKKLNYTNFLEAKSIDYYDIRKAIQLTQSLYSRLSLSESVEVVSGFITNELYTSPAITYIQYLHRMFYKSAGTQLPVNKGFILNKIYATLFDGEEFLTIEPKLEGSIYNVTGFNMDDDLKYADCMGAFMIALRTIMNLDSGKNITIDSFAEFAESFMWGPGQAVPMLPQDLGKVDIEACQRLLTKYWLYTVTSKVMEHESGITYGRFDNLLTDRKYSRNEAHEQILREGMFFASVAYDALLEVGQIMRSLSNDPGFYFPDMTSLKIRYISKFVNGMVDKLSNFSLEINNPKALYEPANLLSRPVSEAVTRSIPDIYFTDSQIRSLKTPIMGPDFSLLAFTKSEIISGSVLGSGSDVDPRLYYLATSLQAGYSITIPSPMADFGMDALIKGFAVRSMEDIVKTDLTDFLKSDYTIMYIMDYQDLADRLELPLPIAKTIFDKYSKKGAGALFGKLNSMSTVRLLIDPNLFPVYEVVESADNILITPYVAKYPAFTRCIVKSGTPGMDAFKVTGAPNYGVDPAGSFNPEDAKSKIKQANDDMIKEKNSRIMAQEEILKSKRLQESSKEVKAKKKLATNDKLPLPGLKEDADDAIDPKEEGGAK